mmetsp:Transcript_42428/g.76466  ORF Transcript_42428/g.76466 Transcript_42428/m.76466 type:complete len:100 (-) Transcript_42428:41-340(-)
MDSVDADYLLMGYLRVSLPEGMTEGEVLPVVIILLPHKMDYDQRATQVASDKGYTRTIGRRWQRTSSRNCTIPTLQHIYHESVRAAVYHVKTLWRESGF